MSQPPSAFSCFAPVRSPAVALHIASCKPFHDTPHNIRCASIKLLPQNVPAVPGSIDTQEVATLLRKEQLNSYGILAPPPQPSHPLPSTPTASTSTGEAGVQGDGSAPMTDEEAEAEGERVLRGSALYARASLINHECNPNVARFDAFDQQGPGSTHVCFRAMHDLPPGA
jgi:SET and MYND domain-containing protein